MKVTWAIEQWETRFSDFDRLKASCEAQGHEVVVFSHQEAYEEHVLPERSGEECIVFFGSIGVAKKVRSTKPWIPGVYWTSGHYDCTYYYPRLGTLVMNADRYVMLPYGELPRRKEWLYEVLGEDRAIFIRPNRGAKEFTGKIVLEEDFLKDIDLMGFYQVEPESLVVASSPVNIMNEWRFIIAGEDVVTGSLYKTDKGVKYVGEYPDEALYIAQQAAKKMSPDIVWVCDICETKSGYFRVLEIGSFSCCGLYECDTDLIVERVSEEAWKEFQDIRSCD